MILARERFEYFEQPLQVNHPRRTKKVRRFKGRTRVLYTGIFLLAFLLGLGLTMRYVQVTTTGYEIVRMKKDMKAMEEDNQQLQMKVENMQSLVRIESVAVNKLGMIKPDPEAGVRFVPIEANENAGLAVRAEQTGARSRTEVRTQIAGSSDSTNIIKAFTELVAGWTGKETAAEARTVK